MVFFLFLAFVLVYNARHIHTLLKASMSSNKIFANTHIIYVSFSHSDPRPAYNGVNRNVEDVSVRLHNWDLLVKNVRGFYRVSSTLFYEKDPIL